MPRPPRTCLTCGVLHHNPSRCDQCETNRETQRQRHRDKSHYDYTYRKAAKKEATSGKAIKRARQILHTLSLHPEGLTYKQVGDLLNLHHGQSSGALSILHQNGVVFMLRTKINRCHVYVHSDQRYKYEASERIDEPASTVAGRKRKELQRLLELVIEQISNGNITDSRIIACATQLKNHK